MDAEQPECERRRGRLQVGERAETAGKTIDLAVLLLADAERQTVDLAAVLREGHRHLARDEGTRQVGDLPLDAMVTKPIPRRRNKR
jgi:hypothetical protein